jgi:hypothetical protein
MYPENNRLTREEALRLWTAGSAWFSGEDGRKGVIRAGQYADLAVLSEDYFTIPEERIKGLESVLTVLGGRIVYGAKEFAPLAPPPLPFIPDWSPPGKFGGYRANAGGHETHGHCRDHWHGQIWLPDERRFWNLDCDCFAF